ncbi:MAG: fumarate hydratase [Planctomycetes bacterium]|nr:fumarate hydratase [Planctomycetota bacterium]
MKEIDSVDITNKVADLCIQANYCIPVAIIKSFQNAVRIESSEKAKSSLNILIENANIAKNESMAYCQDTGVAVVFVKIGQDVRIKNGSLENAINAGVKKGYEDGFLRKSLADPLTRKNTGDNTPAVIHYDILPGEALEITVAPKGFGSENMSQLKMLNPTAGKEGITEFIIKVIKDAGGNPCPPLLVGIGIGGTFEKAALISKKALIRPLGQPNPDNAIAEFEKDLLDKINATGIGPMGLGGKTTALAVHIETYPTHIAGLPVAVNLCCHAVRHATATF